MGNSGVERIARWVVVALLAGVFPLVAWSGGCSSKTLVEPNGSAGGNGGSGGTSGAGGTTGVGGTTGAGGTAAVGGGGGTCPTGRGGFNGYNYVPPPCGGSGGAAGAGGQSGGGGSGGSGQGGDGGSIDGGIQCCSGAPSLNPPKCSQDGRQMLRCESNAQCFASPGGYSLMMVLHDCPGGCVMHDGSTQPVCNN